MERATLVFPTPGGLVSHDPSPISHDCHMTTYLPIESPSDGARHTSLPNTRWSSEAQDLPLHGLVQLTHCNKLLQNVYGLERWEGDGGTV